MSFKKAILVGMVTSSVIATTAMGMTHFYARSGRDGVKVFTEAKFSNMPGDGSYGTRRGRLVRGVTIFLNEGNYHGRKTTYNSSDIIRLEKINDPRYKAKGSWNWIY